MRWLWGPRSIWMLRAQARLAVRLMREPRVPLAIKSVPLLSLLYVLSPVDFLPDILPLLGQIDDAGLVLLTVGLFLRLCPQDAVTHHRAAIAAGKRFSPMQSTDGFIDAEWRRD